MFKQAAEGNLPEAITQLGHIYETGGYEEHKTGVFYPLIKKNIDKAMALYAKSASLGDEQALNFLGAYQFNHQNLLDQGVAKFRKAAQSGNCARALNNLALCFEKGYGDCQ